MGKRDREILENVTIEAVAAEGNALARVNGKAVFVPFCIPGDVVDVQITHKRSSYSMGYVLRTITPSPLRIAPFCAHFGDCGGCKWQTLPYPKQLEYKQQQVVDQLSRIGKLELPAILPILASAKTRNYRNKLEFTFSHNRWRTFGELRDSLAADPERDTAAVDEPALGFHVGGRFDKVLDIDTCYLQEEPSNAIRLEIKRYAIEKGLSFFDLRAQTGFLRNLMIRTTSTLEVMVLVVFAHENKAAGETGEARIALMEHLKNTFPQITSLQYTVNTKKNDNFTDLDIVCYSGRPFIIERMEDLEFKVGPKSFYQTNSEQALELYKTVRTFAALKPTDKVYDLYTGTGTIALFLSRECKEVIGIEYVPEAIDDARENAKVNNIRNARFFAGDMKDVLTKDFIEKQGKPDVIILDPPRAGVHPDVIDVLLLASPKRMVYVSCNPATQARDLQVIANAYKVTAVQPVDMFPHTHHVENVVLLERIDK